MYLENACHTGVEELRNTHPINTVLLTATGVKAVPLYSSISVQSPKMARSRAPGHISPLQGRFQMSISNASVHEPAQGPLRPQGGKHGPPTTQWWRQMDSWDGLHVYYIYSFIHRKTLMPWCIRGQGAESGGFNARSSTC